MATKKHVRVLLKEHAEKSGVSLREIGRDTNIALANLSNIAAGNQLASLRTIETLCNYFQIEVGDLVKMEK